MVDRSGSMETIREGMEGGIKSLLAEQANEPGRCLVTLAQFDTDYEVLYDGVPVAELRDSRLVPRGATALLEPMGRTIASVRARLKALPREKRPAHTGSNEFVVRQCRSDALRRAAGLICTEEERRRASGD